MRIVLKLDDEYFEKVEKIKKYYGIRTGTDLIRFLITEKYREIQE